MVGLSGPVSSSAGVEATAFAEVNLTPSARYGTRIVRRKLHSDPCFPSGMAIHDVKTAL
jgi:hypothetical protein